MRERGLNILWLGVAWADPGAGRGETYLVGGSEGVPMGMCERGRQIERETDGAGMDRGTKSSLSTGASLSLSVSRFLSLSHTCSCR